MRSRLAAHPEGARSFAGTNLESDYLQTRVFIFTRLLHSRKDCYIAVMPAQQIPFVTAPHRLHSASRAFTSATSVALTGAVSPTFSASRGIAPLITSISDGCRERWSSSMDGRASGILAPKLRIYSSGSPTQPYAECVSDFNCFQSAMLGYPPSVRIGQYFADRLAT